MAQIKTVEALRDRLGNPHTLTQQKIYDHLFEEAVAFIGRAPLAFMATVSGEGEPTVSPKGDGPGFVRVEGTDTLLVPERPGNKLAHGLTNIIETGKIGLIFLIPGMEETLRVNGTCVLDDDAALCADMAARGQDAVLVMHVSVEECFFHCAKAFKRSQTWTPDSWPEPISISFGDIIARNAGGNKVKQKAVEIAVNQSVKLDYKKNL
ncbi:MAG: MSMEG_1061 family FMN-dependent PPOX-type flavoprotein [Alphaproteobacteria bacterium]